MFLSHSKYLVHIPWPAIAALVAALALAVAWRRRVARRRLVALDWPANLATRTFRQNVGLYCTWCGWEEIAVSFKAIEADYYIKKDGTRLILVCLQTMFERRGENLPLAQILQLRLIRTRENFDDPVIYLYQGAIDDMAALEQRGFMVLHYRALPEAMAVALQGTPESAAGGWQRQLLTRTKGRCAAASQAFEVAGDLPQALAWAEAAVEAAPRDARQHTRLAELQLKLGNLPAAERAVRRSMALAPGSTSQIWLMAVIGDRMGDKGKALEYARRWSNMRSSHATAHLYLIRMLQKYQEPDQALAAARAGAAMLPGESALAKAVADIGKTTGKAELDRAG